MRAKFQQPDFGFGRALFDWEHEELGARAWGWGVTTNYRSTKPAPPLSPCCGRGGWFSSSQLSPLAPPSRRYGALTAAFIVVGFIIAGFIG